jgi:uncharacterized protein with PQ loop repeat
MLVFGILGHFIFVLQTYKIISTGSAKDVSLPGFCIACLSMVSWLFYGILKEDYVLVAVNAFGVLASATCIVSILWLR